MLDVIPQYLLCTPEISREYRASLLLRELHTKKTSEVNRCLRLTACDLPREFLEVTFPIQVYHHTQ